MNHTSFGGLKVHSQGALEVQERSTLSAAPLVAPPPPWTVRFWAYPDML